MNRQQSATSANPFLSEMMSKNSSSSFYRKERAQNHIFNIYQEQSKRTIPNCAYCHEEFSNIFEWHCHMVTFVHSKPFPTKEEALSKHIQVEIKCKYCQQDTMLATSKDHRCFLAEINRLKEMVNDYDKFYCPLICVLCKRARIFSSQALLQIHLVIRHSPMKYPQRCSICNATFRTTDLNVHEVHAMDIHGAELSFLYWNLRENCTIKKQKADGLTFSCALKYYSSRFQKNRPICTDSIKDIFQLTIHTLCFHGYVPYSNLLTLVMKNEESTMHSFHAFESVECRKCGLKFQTDLLLSHHIGTIHTMELMIRKDFIMKKNMFARKIMLHLTCFYCLTIFTSTAELQVHLMVMHGSADFKTCGMCGKRFLDLKKSDRSKLSLNMQWRIIQYHETCHLRQFQCYKLTGIFNERFFDPPILYESELDFAEEFQQKKTSKPPFLFTPERIAFFKMLGQTNYDNQISWEMMSK